MKLISWNVNGLRAALGKGGREFIAASGADIVCLQETKADKPFELPFPQYKAAWNISPRPGYAGTVCLFRKPPLSVTLGIGNAELDNEGRVITLEYPSFSLVNVYVPQSQGALERWYYRLNFDAAFAEYAEKLLKRKSVIIGGDFNVAHQYIDVYPENIRNLENQPGFRAEERGGFDNLLSLGFVDTFRLLHPAAEGEYTWWSKQLNGKRLNRGRRLDYFLASENLAAAVKAAAIHRDAVGSDHAPVSVEVVV